MARIILEMICENSRITVTEISKSIGKTERTVRKYLKEFQDTAVLIRETDSQGDAWVLL